MSVNNVVYKRIADETMDNFLWYIKDSLGPEKYEDFIFNMTHKDLDSRIEKEKQELLDFVDSIDVDEFEKKIKVDNKKPFLDNQDGSITLKDKYFLGDGVKGVLSGKYPKDSVIRIPSQKQVILNYHDMGTEYPLRNLILTEPIKEPSYNIPTEDYDYSKEYDNIIEYGSEPDLSLDQEITTEELGGNNINGTIQKSWAIVKVNSNIYNDSKKVVHEYLKRVHYKKLINSENSWIIKELFKNKEAKTINDILSIKDLIAGISAKAKLNTYIITNNNGLNALDTTDEKGNKLLTRVLGEFIFDDKYTVIPLDNFEPQKTPFIIGDIKAAVKLIKYKDSIMTFTENSSFEDWSKDIQSFKFINHEYAEQLTNSDLCYAIAYLN